MNASLNKDMSRQHWNYKTKGRKLLRPRGLESLLNTLFSNVGNNTNKVGPICLPKDVLNKVNSNIYANENGQTTLRFSPI